MKKLLLSLMIMLSSAANAALFLAIPEDGVKVLVDNKSACTEKSATQVAALKPPAEIKWFGAVVDIHGTKLAACATEIEGKVLLVYEDGDVGVIPTSMFHSVKEA